MSQSIQLKKKCFLTMIKPSKLRKIKIISGLAVLLRKFLVWVETREGQAVLRVCLI